MLFLCLAISALATVNAQCDNCESPNVRSVLFKQSDLTKDCWSDEEMALLYARRLMQELIPKKVTCKIRLLLDYLKIALETARDITCSPRVHKLIVMSMADALGGYLQAYGIPITNAKYYEGSVSYCTARQVNELQTAFKRSLDTNGGGWTKEVFVKRSCSVVPYVIPTLPQSACINLVTSSEPRVPDRRPLRGPVYNSRAPPEPTVPLPFLDDSHSPRAIAVPFRDRSLYSLFSRNSSDILLRYYSTVLSCLGPGGSPSCNDPYSSQRIENFVVSFHAWLGRTILPHLHDDIWYPGFGGVYRIIEEMTGRGLITQDVAYEDASSSDEFSLKSEDKCDTCLKSNIWYNAWIVLAIFAIFWLVVLNLCCLIKFCGRGNENDYPCTPTTSSSGVVLNNLVSMYCETNMDNNEGLGGKYTLSGTSKLNKNLMEQKPTYNGPYNVISRTEKSFGIAFPYDEDSVSIDRLKLAFLLLDKTHDAPPLPTSDSTPNPADPDASLHIHQDFDSHDAANHSTSRPSDLSLQQMTHEEPKATRSDHSI